MNILKHMWHAWSRMLAAPFQFSSVQSFDSIWLYATPWTANTRLPVHHQLLELAQTHIHWVSDAIQPWMASIPFSSCLQSVPASGSFPMSQLFAWGGQNIGVSASASVLPMNIQGWFPLALTGLISLPSKGLSRIFSSTTVQKVFMRILTISESGPSIMHVGFIN